MKHTRLAVALSFLLLGLAGSSSAQDKAMPYYTAGNNFYSQQNYDQAIRYYQYAGQLNPNLWQAYQGLGNCYYAKGDKATALTNYQKALVLNPNNPQLSSFTQSLQAQVGATPQPPSNSATSTTAASTGGPGAGKVLPQFEISPKIVGDVGGTFAEGATASAPATSISGGTGFGGGVEGYYLTDAHLGLGLIINYVTGYSLGSASATIAHTNQSAQPGTATISASSNVSSIEFMPAVKYTFDGTSFRPYLLGSFGYSFISYSATSSVSYSNGPPAVPIPTISGSESTSGPMVQLGGGGEFSMGTGMNLFLQVKYSMIFASGFSASGYTGPGFTLTSIPIEAGMSFDF
jgi:hypothetical protein